MGKTSLPFWMKNERRTNGLREQLLPAGRNAGDLMILIVIATSMRKRVRTNSRSVTGMWPAPNSVPSVPAGTEPGPESFGCARLWLSVFVCMGSLDFQDI